MNEDQKEPKKRRKFHGLRSMIAGLRRLTAAQPVPEESSAGDDLVPEEPLQQQPEAAPELKPAEQTEEPRLMSEPKTLRLKDHGAVRQLWQIWCDQHPSERASGLQTDLSALPSGHPMLLTDREASLEAVLMGNALEQWADARLKQYQALAKEGEIPLPMDAACWCYQSKTGLMAWVFTVPPLNGGALLQPDDLLNVLHTHGITVGIDASVLAELQSRAKYFCVVPAAWGTPMIPGTDGKIIERFERDFQPQMKMDEYGNVDYRGTVYLQLVAKGDVICDVLPPKPGVPGIRVDGKEIPPKPVYPARAVMGTNVELTADGTKMVAAMDGHLEYHRSAFHVKPILQVPGDVDYSSGNVNFRGDVHIRGNVRERFKVLATGVVTVDGLVEGAVIEAGAGIVIANGVLGSQQAYLKSKGTIRVKYLENCTVYAGGDVYAESIVGSSVYCDGNIQVTGGRGVVLGGEMHAANALRANVIGSTSGSITRVYLGVLGYTQSETQQNQVLLKEIEEDLTQTKAELQEDKPERDAAEKAKMHLRCSVLELKREKVLKRQRELSQMDLQVERSRMEGGIVYPGVILNAGDTVKKFDTPWNQCCAVYDQASNNIRFY